MAPFLKKPKVIISTDLNSESFYPGEPVNTRIFISSQDKTKVRAGTVNLICTEVYWKLVSDGKHTRNQKTKGDLYRIEEEFLTPTELFPGTEISVQKSIILPADSPPTISGRVVNLSWQLDVKLDIPKTRDIHEKRAIIVRPITMATPVTEDGEFARSNRITKSNDEGDLALILDSDYGIAGKTLSGRFEVMPKQDISVDGVRVELEMNESAGTKSSKTVVDMVQLENEITFFPGAQRQWLFSLNIPDSAPPSFFMGNSSVEWRVKGILDKRRWKDFSVEYPIRL